jgi:glycerol-3-phosphate dehydrogenase
MNREISLQYIRTEENWDLIVVGGGATGLGIALDAATRGYKTLLIEKGDFANGTSSKSTKLLHGGVRYLRQFQFKLVFEAIRERKILLRNAPHLTNIISFIIPAYSYFNVIYYALGLYFYELLSVGSKIGKTKILSKQKTIKSLNYIKRDNLKGGIRYFDGQFNDSQLCIDIASVAYKNKATVINYFELIDIIKTKNKITAIKCIDKTSQFKYTINCKNLINATGVFADSVLKLDTPNSEKIILPSQGIHLVLAKKNNFIEHALMMPLRFDNRVIFLIPWMDKLILGTTDTKVSNVCENPIALENEITFLINSYNNFCNNKIEKKDILSVFAGLRPLVKINNPNSKTSSVSREHTIFVSDSNMITIIGGKWTTYRKMAEEVIDTLSKINKDQIKPCKTKNISLNLSSTKKEVISDLINNDMRLAERIHDKYKFTKADVYYSIKYEMAINVEDILARRNMLLFLDAKASIEAVQEVASVFEMYFNKDLDWKINQINSFKDFASKFLAV